MNPEPASSEVQKAHSTRPKIPPQVSAILAALLTGFLLGAGTVLYLVARKGLTFRLSAATPPAASVTVAGTGSSPAPSPQLGGPAPQSVPIPTPEAPPNLANQAPAVPDVSGTASAAQVATPAPVLSTAELLPVPDGARRLAIPVAGVKGSDLRDSFGEMRDGTRKHEAIDILAPRNTPVLGRRRQDREALLQSEGRQHRLPVRPDPDLRLLLRPPGRLCAGDGRRVGVEAGRPDRLRRHLGQRPPRDPAPAFSDHSPDPREALVGGSGGRSVPLSDDQVSRAHSTNSTGVPTVTPAINRRASQFVRRTQP